MTERRKILQMISCEPGWYARFRTGVKGEFEYARVIMWVSVRDITETEEVFDHILPLVSGDANYPMTADYADQYAGVAYKPEWKTESAVDE